jgi:hypothetical protein
MKTRSNCTLRGDKVGGFRLVEYVSQVEGFTLTEMGKGKEEDLLHLTDALLVKMIDADSAPLVEQ